jgi:hypothetical protein
MNKVYMIHYFNPDTEREGIDMRGVYTSRDVAEGIMGMKRMFQRVGDETIYSIREMEIHEEADFDAWMKAKGPGAQKAG